MRVIALLLLLGYTLTATCADRYTYWIDQTCNPSRANIREAINDMKVWAASATSKLKSDPPDPQGVQYFARIFSPGGRPGERVYERRLREIVGKHVPTPYSVPSYLVSSKADVLGHPSTQPGISGLGSVSGNTARDRNRANYRFYCDNDRLDPNGRSRWKLRKDPPPSQRPYGYVLMKDRPLYGSVLAARSGIWSEWEDRDNGILKFASQDCYKPNMRAVAYTEKLEGYTSQPHTRVTVTVSSLCLKPEATTI